MHAHFGQSMPRRKQINEVEDRCVVRFREESFQTGDDALRWVELAIAVMAWVWHPPEASP